METKISPRFYQTGDSCRVRMRIDNLNGDDVLLVWVSSVLGEWIILTSPVDSVAVLQKTVPLDLNMNLHAMCSEDGWETKFHNAKAIIRFFEIEITEDPTTCKVCKNTGAAPSFIHYVRCECGRPPRAMDGGALHGDSWLANELDLTERK